MEMAWRVPHVTTFEEVDALHLSNLRQSLKAEAVKAYRRVRLKR